MEVFSVDTCINYNSDISILDILKCDDFDNGLITKPKLWMKIDNWLEFSINTVSYVYHWNERL